MEIITTLIASISINLIIHIILINYLSKGIIENFKVQDEYNNLLKENIENIYDIIKYNGLVRKPKVEEDIKE